VSLVAILDADKEGFLRSTRSLIQTIGRAARNVGGEVILYADRETHSIRQTMAETQRRRELQQRYNQEHGITPKSIEKRILTLRASIWESDYVTVPTREQRIESDVPLHELPKIIEGLGVEMRRAAEALEFERAAELRDRIRALERERMTLG
jgi:excinuclease ABC subunit B